MSDEEKIQEYMKQGHMKAGKMMKIGEVVVNSGVAVEAWRRRTAQMEEEKERDQTMAGLDEQEVALCYYDDWLRGEKVLDKNKKPKLGNKGAKAMVKALMPRVAPDKKVKEYTTAMYKCVDWLEGLGKGVWELEMEKMREDYSRGTVAAHIPLPGFENCFDPLND